MRLQIFANLNFIKYHKIYIKSFIDLSFDQSIADETKSWMIEQITDRPANQQIADSPPSDFRVFKVPFRHYSNCEYN